MRKSVAFGHVTVEDDHSRDVKRDRRREEGDIWITNQLVMYNDHVVGRYDS